MSYLSQPQTSNRKMIALGVAAIVHIFLGYALVTGLAYNAVQKLIQKTEVVDIKQEKPPEEPPPPPPEKLEEIPVVTPPPLVTVQNQAPPPPTITTVVTNAVPPAPSTAPVQNLPPPAPPPPAAPKAPEVPAQGVTPRGDPHSWFSNDDYPEAARRENAEGTTQAQLQIDANGKVTACSIVRSSGNKDLDDVTCRIASRRGRFKPAQAAGGEKMAAQYTLPPIRWVLPKE